MKTPRLLLAVLALTFVGCQENEEEWIVRADGSVTVRVRASGVAEDLAGGYSVPLGGEWTPTSDATRTWLATIGSDTGSPNVQDRVRRGAWRNVATKPDEKVTLEVEARFASVENVPTTFASSDEPYGKAYLVRTATLSIREQAGRRVYVLERRFHSRDKQPFDLVEIAGESVPEEFAPRLSQGEALARDEKLVVIDAFVGPLREANERVLRDVLASIYRLGDAALPLASYERALAEGRERIEQATRVADILRVWEEVERRREEEDPEVALPLDEFRANLRDALREAVRSLARDGVSAELVHGALYELESFYTREDHTGDLADESFQVSIAMPGTIVSGVERDEKGRAVFKFEGKDLAQRDIVMRVISIEE